MSTPRPKPPLPPQMPSVLDREVRNSADDAFGHQHFADALRSLIESATNPPPFSIGLLGPWGTGKSTIKELYLATLENDSAGKPGQRRKDRIHTITFNAWRHGGEDIKRALLRHAFVALGGDENTLCRELYQQVSESGQKQRPWWEWLKETVAQNAASVLVFLVLLAAVMLLALGFANWVGLKSQTGLSVLGSCSLGAAVFLAKYVVDLRLRAPTLFTPTTTISFPATSAEEYEQLLLRQLRKFKMTSKGRDCERLVVFVDDLDRLSAAEMVAGSDAVRTFLDLPSGALPEGLGVIFAISCDEDRVAEALAKGRGRLGSSDLPGSVFTRSDARRYLDRMFQFRLEIPQFPKVDMRLYAKQKFDEMKWVATDLEGRQVRVDDVLERLIHVGVQSPRNALQLLNAFAQTWWIASRREWEATGSGAPGCLHDGAVTKHPLALAALCVLRVDFPDFYNHLQMRPDLIKCFSSVLFGAATLDQLPEGAQAALREFLDDKATKEVRAEHRDLRRYLASLRSLRWPERLQPLLLLAQDAISRQYGDKAPAIHDAFVSGDTQGILEAFGRHLDDKPLADSDVTLLVDLAEEVAQDTPARQTNAARVLAELVDRVPAKHARALMSPLARQLVSLKAVRMNVGPSAAGKIIQHLAADDQRDVAAAFVSDLLAGGESEWRLPSGESPGLEQLVQAVRDAVSLALDVRRQHGLPVAAERDLLKWLEARDVRIGDNSRKLPFSDLNEWVSEHESHLMPEFGAVYCDLAIAEFEAEEGAIADEAETIRRIEEQFTTLNADGEQSRRQLWELLTRLIAVRSSTAVGAGCKTATAYAGVPSGKQACATLTALADRLSKEMNDKEAWSLDRNAGARTLLALLDRWSDIVDSETAEHIGELIRAWSDISETSTFAATGFELLERIDANASGAVMNHMVAKAFGSLGEECRIVIAARLDQLSSSQKQSLVAQMNAVYSSDDVDEMICNDYVKFVKFVQQVPKPAWAAKPLAQHVEGLLNRLQDMFKNPQFLARLFPAGRELMTVAPNGRGASFLTKLFEQAAGTPKSYVLLHREMVGAWPDESGSFAGDGATQIVERAVQFVEQNGSTPGVESVLDSISELVDRGIVADSARELLPKAASLLWPYCPEAVARNASKIGRLMKPADISAILTGTQPDGDCDEALRCILAAARESQDFASKLATTRDILEANPVNVNGLLDAALSAWLNALHDKLPEVLQALLAAEDLNDAQKERLYRAAIMRKDSLGIEFFVSATPLAIGAGDFHRLRAAAVDSIDAVTAIAVSDEQKSALVNALLPPLGSITGHELEKLATVIRKLGGTGALQRSNVLESMDEVQLGILGKALPDSRLLRKAIKDRSKNPA